MLTDCESKGVNHAVLTAYKWISAASGSLSIIGSSLIIYIIIRRGRSQLSRVRNRLLLGLSVVDLLSSAARALSFLPTPKLTACSYGIGNLSTCAAQGFFVQLGMAGPGYNAMLSIYFLMTVRYGIESTIIAKKYELLMHAYAITPVLTTAIIGVAKNMYFGAEKACWFLDVCQVLGSCPKANIWGNGQWVVIFTAVFNVLNMACTIFCILATYWSLRQVHLAIQRHAFQPHAQTVRHRRPPMIEFAANESFKQAILYFAGFTLTWVWTSIIVLVIMFGGAPKLVSDQVWYTLSMGLFLPLQGFWNFFAFICPMVSAIQRREHNNNVSFISAVKKIISGESQGVIERRRSAPRCDAVIDIQTRVGENAEANCDRSPEPDISLSIVTP